MRNRKIYHNTLTATDWYIITNSSRLNSLSWLKTKEIYEYRSVAKCFLQYHHTWLKVKILDEFLVITIWNPIKCFFSGLSLSLFCNLQILTFLPLRCQFSAPRIQNIKYIIIFIPAHKKRFIFFRVLYSIKYL